MRKFAHFGAAQRWQKNLVSGLRRRQKKRDPSKGVFRGLRYYIDLSLLRSGRASAVGAKCLGEIPQGYRLPAAGLHLFDAKIGEFQRNSL
jgi:hypothetical protein